MNRQQVAAAMGAMDAVAAVRVLTAMATGEIGDDEIIGDAELHRLGVPEPVRQTIGRTQKRTATVSLLGTQVVTDLVTDARAVAHAFADAGGIPYRRCQDDVATIAQRCLQALPSGLVDPVWRQAVHRNGCRMRANRPRWFAVFRQGPEGSR